MLSTGDTTVHKLDSIPDLLGAYGSLRRKPS